MADAIRSLSGLRRIGVGVAAGAVSILAMAPFHVSPILALTLPVLVWLLEGGVARSATSAKLDRALILGGFVAGWGFGFGYHLVGLFWIGEAFLVEADVFAWLLPFAVTLLPAAMAIYWGVAAALAAVVWQRFGATRSPLWRIAVLALALALGEWSRGHMFTGFPWNVLGYALTHPLVLMQSAGLIGIYGLTIAIVLVFATPLVTLAMAKAAPDRRDWRQALAVPVAVMTGLAAYGMIRLAPTPPALDGVRIRIVQPSIPQRQKWRSELQRRFFEEHLALSGAVAPATTGDDFTGITHILWPEAAMPFGPLRSPEALGKIANRIPDTITLIAGALRSGDQIPPGRDRPLAYNSLLAFGPGASLVALYDKIHLVPYGEYLPYQQTLEWIGLEQLSRMRGGFSAGPVPRPAVPISGLPPAGVLICYEAIFPAAVVQGGVRPGLLINITNDGWFGNTTGPRQHYHQSRVRAVEEGISLIRAANNGISGLVDPYGRVIGRLDLDVRATLDLAIPRATSPPLYARLGDALFLMMLVAGAAGLWVTGRGGSNRTMKSTRGAPN